MQAISMIANLGFGIIDIFSYNLLYEFNYVEYRILTFKYYNIYRTEHAVPLLVPERIYKTTTDTHLYY